MIWLLRDFDLLSVIVRGLLLSLEIVTIGGVSFVFAVARRGNETSYSAGSGEVSRACWRGIAWAAAALAVAEIAAVAIDSAILVHSAPLQLIDLVAAPYFVAGSCGLGAALVLFLCARLQGRFASAAAVPSCGVLLVATVATSHSVSRMDDRVLLALLTAAHHIGAAMWIGAIPFLLIALKSARDSAEARRLVKRFSPMALIGAGTLLLGGIGMAWFYLGASSDKSLSGVYGTAYGVMLLAKIYLLLMVVTLGAGNFFLVKRIDSAPDALLLRLRRFGEAEIGLAFTAVLAAASMTSQPPAVDLHQDRLNVAEIVARFRPELPRLTSPSLDALRAPTNLQAALVETQFNGSSDDNDANDRAWSEYNHHWSGLIVLAAGILALLSRLPHGAWARNWPIVFAGLAVFIILRADPEAWPLGPRPFWASMSAPDILQHRLYALLILAFAAFEWGIQTGRLHSPRAALVFPILCAVAGALLMTHNHALGNIKEELLAEMSHTPIALLGATAGWSRWLELRLPEQKDSRIASWIWPVCLIFSGLVLLDYREA